MICVVGGSAESHFHLALDLVQEFGSSMEERPVSGVFKRLKEYHQGKRAGTHMALMLAYSRIALCAPREQLLARVESDIVRGILQHYRASCQVLGFTISTKVSAARWGLASCPGRAPFPSLACRARSPARRARVRGLLAVGCRESLCLPGGSFLQGGERRFPSSDPRAEPMCLRLLEDAVVVRCALGLAAPPCSPASLWPGEALLIGAAVFLSPGPQDVQLKLTLVQSVAEVSRAMQGAGGSHRVELSSKRELLGILLGLVKEEPRDCLASPLRQEAFLALGHLSKLKPSLSREENRDLLDQCLQSAMPLPAPEQAEEEGAAAADALRVQCLHAQTMGALGELVTALLEEDLTSGWCAEMLHVLEYWLTSAKEWERERALQACAQLLGAYEERFERTGEKSFELFGSMVGLLAPFVCDSPAASRQRAGACLGHLLRIRGKTLDSGAEEDEVQPLCQRLSAPDAEAQLQASSRLAKIICKYIPEAQATDFISAALDGMLSVRSACAQAAGEWLVTFLEKCGGQLSTKVPEILSIIYIRMPTMQQDTLRRVLLEAVSVLALYHPGAVIDSLLQKQLPMDRYAQCPGPAGRQDPPPTGRAGASGEAGPAAPGGESLSAARADGQSPARASPLEARRAFGRRRGGIAGRRARGLTGELVLPCSGTVELWRVLGRKFFVQQLLRALMEKLERSGNDQPRSSSAEAEADDGQAALEPLKITRAIGEVVSTQQTPEAVQRLLPELLPVLLKQISATLGKEMPFSQVSTRGKLFLKGHTSDDNPCRLSLETLEVVLRTSLEEKWLRPPGSCPSPAPAASLPRAAARDVLGPANRSLRVPVAAAGAEDGRAGVLSATPFQGVPDPSRDGLPGCLELRSSAERPRDPMRNPLRRPTAPTWAPWGPGQRCPR
nr:PREDICTED: maestro heat-like repeat-containing protein family member 2B [Struthio camelus australis]